MLTRINSALRARRGGLGNDEGFTLIELLVVVIIIGVLAAIAIPVYLGIQNNSKDSAVQSDLTNAKTAILSVQTTTGSLPTSAADVSSKVSASDGYTKSSYTGTIKYTASATGFCLASTSTTGTKFYVTESTGVTKATSFPTGC